MHVGKLIVVGVILFQAVEGRAQENDRPVLASTTTRAATCAVSPPCAQREVDFSKTEMLIQPQNRRSGGQAASYQPRSWVHRHPVLTGALIGATIGATLGATGGTEPGTSRAAQIVFTTGVGAGIGALVGRAFR